MVELWAAMNGVTVGSSNTYVKCKSYCRLIEWTCLIGAESMVNYGIWQAGNEDDEACISTLTHTHTHMHMRMHAHTRLQTHTYTRIHTHIHTQASIIDCNKTTTATSYTNTHTLSHTHAHT